SVVVAVCRRTVKMCQEPVVSKISYCRKIILIKRYDKADKIRSVCMKKSFPVCHLEHLCVIPEYFVCQDRDTDIRCIFRGYFLEAYFARFSFDHIAFDLYIHVSA